MKKFILGQSMTPAEFKAWFDGFCEGIEGAPSVDQFERIKERVAEINAAPTQITKFEPVLPTGIPMGPQPYCKTYGTGFATSCLAQ